MHVPVGPFSYTVELVDGYPQDSAGNPCLGTCDTVSQAIRIARNASPRKRLATFWHEFAHAVKAELDVGEAECLTEEPLCNLIGLAMSFLTPKQLCMIHMLLIQGRPCDDVVMLRGTAIPVIRFSPSGGEG